MPTSTTIPQVNMHEAKTNLSHMVRELEEGQHAAFLIARHGKPVARLVPYDGEQAATSKRIGAAKGKFQLKDEHDLFYGAYNDEVIQMFGEPL